MPMAETAPLPPWLRAISNSRLILSTDGAGFQVDCGGTGIVDELKKMRDAGQLATVEHVFVTHYHDDHTDALPVLVDEFGSQVHACASLVDVLERPGDYRLPCLTKNPVRVTASRRDGESWRWREFRMTIYDFPGQTLHHNALLVERDGGGAVLLAGDSFTPSGIDDYCLPNRNFLGPGRGLLRCLDLVATLPEDCWVINQHVEPMFRFAPEQIATMRDTLHDRIALVQDLLPCDDPNFGLDEGWAVLHPYAVQVRPGDTARLQLRITNHSPRERTFRAVLHAPSGFAVEPILPTAIAAREDGFIVVGVAIPSGASPGLYVLTADVAWEDGTLCEWAEGLVEVVP
jgi:glyoxylase-like metal-dependent hydrolase (beta-lactamase superfamily II)